MLGKTNTVVHVALGNFAARSRFFASQQDVVTVAEFQKQ
jgi:hypothetical protein